MMNAEAQPGKFPALLQAAIDAFSLPDLRAKNTVHPRDFSPLPIYRSHTPAGNRPSPIRQSF